MTAPRADDAASLPLSAERRVDEVCRRFEDAWKTGSRPRLEDFAATSADGERPALLRELVRLDICYRRASAEAPLADDYLPRFSELDPTWVAELLHADVPLPETLLRPPPTGDTTSPLPTTATAAPIAAALPGYELLGDLGRGGMGVVYRARQTNLNRVVALKMILAGGHAAASELARFRTEAEAIGRLQHPNIVQVHEVGEHEGRPFFSLEFCGGGSLEKKLAGTPLPAREAAQLVEMLARAMQAAHDHRIIHRDLKPANVLLTADGTPKIADFGLAKKLDEAGQTQSGAVMGTPSYTAPEQAGGKTSDVGPAADIYALGAILYECLTGRPPFKAETALDTLRQVVSDEPVPPSQLHSKTPRDLETICLKCLQKEPRKRYATAAELADDLGRFLRGEPVRARPVGRVERATKWTRRNPAVATLMAAVTVSLISGTAVATYFAMDANKKKTATDEAYVKLTDVNNKLLEEKHNVEGNWARGWVLALSLNPWTLDERETDVLDEVAANRNDHVTLRFYEVAIGDPKLTRRLGARPQYMAQAALGLDAAKRKEVVRLLAERLAAPGLTPQERADLALGLAALGDIAPETAGDAAAALAQAMTRTTDAFTLRNLAENLAALADRMDRKAAARVCAKGAAAVTAALRENKIYTTAQILNMSQATLAARMDQVEAAPTFAGVDVHSSDLEPDTQQYRRVCLAFAASRLDPREAVNLAQAMARTNDFGALNHFAQVLSALAPRLGPEEAAEAGALLVPAMTTSTQFTAPYLVKALTALAARMEARAASRLCADAADALTSSKMARPNDRAAVALRLSELAARMEPRDAARVCADAAGLIVPDLTKHTDPFNFPNLVYVLVAVTARMEPGVAADFDAVIAHLLLSTDPASESLSVVAARMEPGDAARVCAEAARQLVEGPFPAKRPDFKGQEKLAQRLSALAAYMEPRAAIEALAQALAQTNAPSVVTILQNGLSAAAARLDPQAAREVAVSIAQTMTKATNSPYTLEMLAKALSEVMPRMDAEEAARVCADAAAAIRQGMAATTTPNIVLSLANGLAAVAAWMKPGDAAKSAEALAQVATKMNNRDPYQGRLLAQSLSALAARMEPGDAARVADKLARAMTDTALPDLRIIWAYNLSAVSDHLEPAEAAEVAAALVRAMDKTDIPVLKDQLAYNLSAVTFRMETKEAVALLRQVKTRSNDPAVLQKVALAMARVATRMDPEDARRVSAEAADTYLQDFAKTATKHPHVLLTELSTLTAAMEAKEAARVYAEVGASITQAMADLAKSYQCIDQANLARDLADLAERMNPQDAARVCAEAAATLLQAMSVPETVNGSDRLNYVADALSAMAAHMEPREATRVYEKAALIFMQTMTKTYDRKWQASLAYGLSIILHRERGHYVLSFPVRRANRASILVGLGASPTVLVPTAALTHPALGSPPEPLPAETLVQLLKHPLCVGESRRAVLDALGTRFGRSFVDQWDFVRFAEEQKLELKLAGPPKRPEQPPASGGR
jgi:serine/threonine protein kinase